MPLRTNEAVLNCEKMDSYPCYIHFCCFKMLHGRHLKNRGFSFQWEMLWPHTGWDSMFLDKGDLLQLVFSFDRHRKPLSGPTVDSIKRFKSKFSNCVSDSYSQVMRTPVPANGGPAPQCTDSFKEPKIFRRQRRHVAFLPYSGVWDI